MQELTVVKKIRFFLGKIYTKKTTHEKFYA